MLKIRSFEKSNSAMVIKNIINTFIIKGGAIIVGLLTTPAYMQYFEDNAILGVWFTILSILTWILSFDLGIGNGLRNKLVVLFVNDEKIKIKKYISSAYIFLFLVCIIVGLIIMLMSQLLNWNHLFNISTALINSDELRIAVNILLVSILLQFVLRLITSIFYALQKSFIPNMLILITNILLLLFVITCNKLGNNNNIIYLAVAYLIAVNVPLVISTIYLFSTQLNYAIPNKKYFDKNFAFETLKLGIYFLFIQIVAMLVNNTSVFLINYLVSPGEVVEYNVYYKIFSVFYTFFSLLTVPIWSAVTRAIAENNIIWIMKMTRLLQIAALIFSILQFIFIPFMQIIFDIWLGNESFSVNYQFMILFAIEQAIMIWAGLNASVANGLGELKIQFILLSIGGIMIFIFSFIFTKYFPSYITIVISHSIALLPYCIGQTIWLEKYFKKE